LESARRRAPRAGPEFDRHAQFFSYPANFTHYPTTNYYYENTSPDLGTNEFTMLDVIGWTLFGNVPQAPVPAISVARTGKKLSLSWPTNVAGYIVEERTNLDSGSWGSLAGVTKSPVSITISNVQEFYRLKNTNEEPAFAPEEPTPAEPFATAPAIRRIRAGMRPSEAKRPVDCVAPTKQVTE
jgi:hypothetical protein